MGKRLTVLLALLESAAHGKVHLYPGFVGCLRTLQNLLHGGDFVIGKSVVLEIRKTVVGLAEIGLQLDAAQVSGLSFRAPAQRLQHVPPR